MKIGRYLLMAALLMGLPITFGDRGLLDNFRKNQQLLEIQKSNHQLTIENIVLKRNIMLLRDDLSYIEMTARSELGMVKKGDLVYRKEK